MAAVHFSTMPCEPKQPKRLNGARKMVVVANARPFLSRLMDSHTLDRLSEIGTTHSLQATALKFVVSFSRPKLSVTW